MGVVMGSSPDFRALTGAASLKEQALTPLARADSRFPRPNRRGLIEGMRAFEGPLTVLQFPRPNRRGLIEGAESTDASGKKTKISAP